MSQPIAPLIDLDKIDVTEGFNVRTHMDEVGIERLAANFKRVGVVQPVVVVSAKDGRFALVAGHRRLRAAQVAGFTQIPGVLGDAKTARVANLVENLHQEELDPIDRARGLKALAEEHGLATHKQIAEEVSKSTAWVSQHMRLLELPEGVQRHVAQGSVPVEAERCLREVAKVSPRVAECVCELAKRRKVKPSRFIPCFGELLSETAEARFEERPTMISVRAVQLGKVITDAKKRRDLSDRYQAARPDDPEGDPVIRFGEAEVDAARAAGCLVEHRVDRGTWFSTVAFITDATLAADLIERAVERIEAEAAQRAERERKWRARFGGTDPDATPEQEKQARKAKRAEAKAKQEQARRFNEDLGRKLLQRRGGTSRKEHALARAKALAAIVLADNESLAARGLRLVTAQLQEVEVKQLKTNGETREKVSYADPEQCTEYLRKRVKEASSAGEVLELLGDTVIASLLADEAELPQSKRVGGSISARAEVEKLLSADIKSVRPRRQGPKSRI
ncbi:MAG: ParB/RepB/Spo0J family partition protein [Solirubrobacterales bacterium]